MTQPKKKIFILCTLLVIVGGFFQAKVSAAFNVENEQVSLVKGDLESIKTYELSRISITKTGVIDIVSMDEDKVLVVGQSAGKTTLLIWDKYGKRQVDITVVEEDLNDLKQRIQTLLGKRRISGVNFEVDKTEGKLILTGTLPKSAKDDLDKLVDPFYQSIINWVKAKDESALVQIDAQILEFTGSYSKSLGMDWTSALTYSETVPSEKIDKAADIFRLGDFKRTTQILSTFNALITEGKGKVLSKPKLVVASGKSANFLVGGEIPITETTTSSGGNVQQDVSFKDYGVGLNITPTIKDKNRVEIQLELEVSDVDSANSVAGQPAFTTRSAQTELFMDDGETVVMAGLIKQNRGTTVTKVPLLGDIPIAGALFRSKKTPANETDTELVITLTPTILRAEKPPVQQTRNMVVPQMDEEPTAAIQARGKGSGQISKGAMAATALIPSDILPYMKTIQQKIAQRLVYPDDARRYGWAGTVKLALVIDQGGSLQSATVAESSGYNVFDQDALNLVRRLAPYAGFPKETGLEELTVTIPIVYSLDTF